MNTTWFRRHLAQTDPMPAGFGVAWIHPHTGQLVAFPLGINIAAAWVRRIWLALVIGLSPTFLDQWLRAQGQAARREGRDEALQDVQRQLEQRFGQRVKTHLTAAVDAGDPIDAAVLGDAAAEATEVEYWTDEERVFFAAAQELARRKGDALFFACQDPRCQQQPVIARIDGDGGFWLACFHKRRWVPDPPGGTRGTLSRRALARLGVH